jgi:glucose-1-phosphate cytidylyltransferase
VKVVILAGGLGTRLSEETELRPKPLVEIGGHPIIWHIMKHYVHHGFNEFVVALGYKGEEIKRYFLDYHRLRANLTVDLATGQPNFHEAADKAWTVHLIDTGLKTNTGARVKHLQPWLEARLSCSPMATGSATSTYTSCCDSTARTDGWRR